jgi:hypothetical protein
MNLGIQNYGSKISGAADAVDLHVLAGVKINRCLSGVYENAGRGILNEEFTLSFVFIGHDTAQVDRITKLRLFGWEFPDLPNGRQNRQALREPTLLLLGSRETGEKRESHQKRSKVSVEALPCL